MVIVNVKAADGVVTDIGVRTVLSPRLAETFAKLRMLVATGNSLSAIDEIEAFVDGADEKILLNLSSERLHDSPEAIASALRAALPGVESILVQDRRADKFELFGPGYLSYSAGGADFSIQLLDA